MKQLYRVETIVMVMAEDAAQAEDVACAPTGATVNVYKASSVPSEWYSAIPFGTDNDNATCGEILKQNRRQRQHGAAVSPNGGYDECLLASKIMV